jgi:SAM-dependent methyltransferase
MKDYKNLKYPNILGTGLQRYDVNDFDTAGSSNSMTVFNEEIWPDIKEYFVNKEHVVDVGCGNGRHSAVFSGVCKTVTAIDPFRELNKRNIRDNINFIKTSIQDFEVTTPIDVLYLHGVFYLMDNWNAEKAFKKMSSMLQPGGIIIIADDKKRNVTGSPPWHPGYYNLDYLCSQHNCEIIKNSVVPSGMLRMIIVRRCIDE